jgi:hypothetical protein
MIILNLGIPRSGTVWSFNVFRLLWERRQVPFRVENPNSTLEMDDCLARIQPGESIIIHGHEVTHAVRRLAAQPDVRAFFNFRDPRDVVVSQMRLHDIPLRVAIDKTALAFHQFQAALSLPGAMIIPYDHIATHAESLIFQMATRVGILLPLTEARDIAEATSADNHRRVMQDVNSGASTNLARIDTATVPPRTMRFDSRHLITDRHLQSGKSGRWRDELTPADSRLVDASFTRLVQLLGFDG